MSKNVIINSCRSKPVWVFLFCGTEKILCDLHCKKKHGQKYLLFCSSEEIYMYLNFLITMNISYSLAIQHCSCNGVQHVMIVQTFPGWEIWRCDLLDVNSYGLEYVPFTCCLIDSDEYGWIWEWNVMYR